MSLKVKIMQRSGTEAMQRNHTVNLGFNKAVNQKYDISLNEIRIDNCLQKEHIYTLH